MCFTELYKNNHLASFVLCVFLRAGHYVAMFRNNRKLASLQTVCKDLVSKKSHREGSAVLVSRKSMQKIVAMAASYVIDEQLPMKSAKKQRETLRLIDKCTFVYMYLCRTIDYRCLGFTMSST